MRTKLIGIAALTFVLIAGSFVASGVEAVTTTVTFGTTQTIGTGQSANLTWTATPDGIICNSNDFDTGGASSGQTSVSPASTKTYSITCGAVTKTVTITVVATPSATLTGSPSSIVQNHSSTLSWSSMNAASCTGTNFTTGSATSGSVSVSPQTTTNYTVTCGTATASFTVTVNQLPTVSVSANPTSITTGNSAVVSWSSSGATSGCSTNANNATGTSGSQSVSPMTTTTYTVTCTNAYGSANAQAVVTVTAPPALGASCSVTPDTTTTGQNVSWYASVWGGTAPYTYLWDGTDSLSGAAPNIMKSYDTAGLKTGQITASDSSNSCQSAPSAENGYRWGGSETVISSDAGDNASNGGGNDNGNYYQNLCEAECGAAGYTACNFKFVNDLSINENSLTTYTCSGVTNPTGPTYYGVTTSGPGHQLQTIYYAVSAGTNCTSASTVTEQCTNGVTVTASGPTPQCSDGIDNNNNGLIDEADPGCHTDGDATNPASYDPNLDTETPTPPAKPECSDGIDNDGNGLVDYPQDPGCSSPNDNNESIPLPTLSLSVTDRVRPQTSTTLTWSVANVKSGLCTITGDNGDSWTLSGLSGTEMTSALTNQTIYTLRCLDLDGNATTSTQTVFIAPSSGEE